MCEEFDSLKKINVANKFCIKFFFQVVCDIEFLFFLMMLQAVQHIQEEIDKMTEKIQLVENVKKSREQKFELQNELAWSKVYICVYYK